MLLIVRYLDKKIFPDEISVNCIQCPKNPAIGEGQICGICLNTQSCREWVAHSGGGETHLAHRTCLKANFLYQSRCPICRAHVNITSVFSLRERVSIWIKKNLHFQYALTYH